MRDTHVCIAQGKNLCGNVGGRGVEPRRFLKLRWVDRCPGCEKGVNEIRVEVARQKLAEALDGK